MQSKGKVFRAAHDVLRLFKNDHMDKVVDLIMLFIPKAGSPRVQCSLLPKGIPTIPSYTVASLKNLLLQMSETGTVKDAMAAKTKSEAENKKVRFARSKAGKKAATEAVLAGAKKKLQAFKKGVKIKGSVGKQIKKETGKTLGKSSSSKESNLAILVPHSSQED